MQLNRIGMLLLVIGGLLVKFALVMSLGIVGYMLIVFGVLVIVTFHEKTPQSSAGQAKL